MSRSGNDFCNVNVFLMRHSDKFGVTVLKNWNRQLFIEIIRVKAKNVIVDNVTKGIADQF